MLFFRCRRDFFITVIVITYLDCTICVSWKWERPKLNLGRKNNFQESGKNSSFLFKKSGIEVIAVTAKPFNRKTNFPDQTTTFLVSLSPSHSIPLSLYLFLPLSLSLSLSVSHSLSLTLPLSLIQYLSLPLFLYLLSSEKKFYKFCFPNIYRSKEL